MPDVGVPVFLKVARGSKTANVTRGDHDPLRAMIEAEEAFKAEYGREPVVEMKRVHLIYSTFGITCEIIEDPQ